MSAREDLDGCTNRPSCTSDLHIVACPSRTRAQEATGQPLVAELLTPAEHAAVAKAGELWNDLCAIVADGPARAGDLSELIFHIHAIQRAVLKQAAARAYPDLYRLLGGDPVQPAPTFVPETKVCPQCKPPEGTA